MLPRGAQLRPRNWARQAEKLWYHTWATKKGRGGAGEDALDCTKTVGARTVASTRGWLGPRSWNVVGVCGRHRPPGTSRRNAVGHQCPLRCVGGSHRPSEPPKGSELHRGGPGAPHPEGEESACGPSRGRAGIHWRVPAASTPSDRAMAEGSRLAGDRRSGFVVVWTTGRPVSRGHRHPRAGGFPGACGCRRRRCLRWRTAWIRTHSHSCPPRWVGDVVRAQREEPGARRTTGSPRTANCPPREDRPYHRRKPAFRDPVRQRCPGSVSCPATGAVGGTEKSVSLGRLNMALLRWRGFWYTRA